MNTFYAASLVEHTPGGHPHNQADHGRRSNATIPRGRDSFSAGRRSYSGLVVHNTSYYDADNIRKNGFDFSSAEHGGNKVAGVFFSPGSKQWDYIRTGGAIAGRVKLKLASTADVQKASRQSMERLTAPLTRNRVSGAARDRLGERLTDNTQDKITALALRRKGFDGFAPSDHAIVIFNSSKLKGLSVYQHESRKWVKRARGISQPGYKWGDRYARTRAR